MKKIIVNLVLILAFVCGFSTVRAKAYSVELGRMVFMQSIFRKML